MQCTVHRSQLAHAINEVTNTPCHALNLKLSHSVRQSPNFSFSSFHVTPHPFARVERFNLIIFIVRYNCEPYFD